MCPGGDVRAGQDVAGGGPSSMIFLGGSMPSLVRMSRWAVVSSVRCRNVPAGPSKVPTCSSCRSSRMPVPGVAGGGLDDPDQEQGEPAEDDVGADAVFEPVVDRPQFQGGLHVPPAAFDLQQLLVAQRDVLGGQVRVRAAQQVLPVQVRLGRDLLLVDAEQPAGGGAQEPVQPGHGGDPPAQLGPLRRAERVGAGDQRGELADHDLAQRGVAFGLLGVVADHEPLVLGDLALL